MKTFLLLFLISSLPCFARLGETEDQCIARYGLPTYLMNDCGRAKEESFSKNNFTIDIVFLDGKSVEELYWHPRDSDGGVCNVSDAEASELLADNAAGGTWKRTEEGYMVNPAWKRDGAMALFDSGNDGARFSVWADSLYQQAEAIIAAAKAKKTTDGI